MVEIESEEEVGRKLASVQIIKSIIKHPNADKLSIASVLGWKVIIQLDQFKEGEKVIYFEIDSLLPQKEWSEGFKIRKYKVKTIQLRGELSQGLIMPISILQEHKNEEGKSYSINQDDYKEGDDLTKILGVTKYDDDSDLDGGNKEKAFPTQFGFFKTDEDRIQSTPKYIELFKNKPFYATMKYDGTSATYFYDMKTSIFYILSRNQIRSDPTDEYSRIAEKLKLKELLAKQEGRYAIQGEIYGVGIQKNPLNLKTIEFVVFSVFDIETQKYLDFKHLVDYCKESNLKMVDVILEGDYFNYSIDELKQVSKGNYPNTTNPREGLVFRAKENWHDNLNNSNPRLSFKIINDDFLIHKEKKEEKEAKKLNK